MATTTTTDRFGGSATSTHSEPFSADGITTNETERYSGGDVGITIHLERWSEGDPSSSYEEAFDLNLDPIPTATDVESASELTAPGFGQIHALLAVSVQSLSELGSSLIGTIHNLTGTNVEATSELTEPTVVETVFALLADDVESNVDIAGLNIIPQIVLMGYSNGIYGSVNQLPVDGYLPGEAPVLVQDVPP